MAAGFCVAGFPMDQFLQQRQSQTVIRLFNLGQGLS